MRTLAFVGGVVFCVGCSSGQTKSAADVSCPEGQTYDGQYCRVDQNVATLETPVMDTQVGDEKDRHRADATLEESGKEAHRDNHAESNDVDDKGEPVEEQSGQLADGVEVDAEESLATPVDYAMAAQAGPVMQYFASAHLPAGSRALGVPFAGQFAEGQVLTRKIQLAQGKCYTIVGVGLPPVVELDLGLFDEATGRALLEDTTKGAQAVLGSRDQCYLSPTSGPAKLVVRVARGQGLAAAQVFHK